MDLAETTRALAVVAAVGDRADVVFMGYGGPFAHLVTDAGHPLRILQPEYDDARLERAWKSDRMESMRSPFSTADLRRRVDSEIRLLAELKPDLVFMGFTLSMYLSARIARVRLVQLVPFAFTGPFFAAGLGRWPDQFAFPGSGLLPEGLLDRLLTRWATRTRMWTRPFVSIGEEHGLTAPSRLIDLWTADVNLVAETADVTGVPELPPTWEYVGPVFARLPGEIPPEIAAIPHGTPWIYCGMGSSGERGVVRSVLDALGAVPYPVMAPVRAPVDEPGYRPPDNVTLLDWLPADRVNPLAALAVIHGGQGTVQTAVASGTPFVGIGMQPEQEWNIDFLVRRGSARRVSRRRVSATTIGSAVGELIADPGARSVAAGLADAYSLVDGARATADRLLTIACAGKAS